MPRTVEAHFEGAGSVHVPAGTTLLEAARRAGVAVDAVCAGLGTCGRCRVQASGALSAPSEEEVAALGEAAIEAGWRLACRARALGDVSVLAASSSGEPHTVLRGELGLPWEPDFPASAGGLGLALDLGTTTLAAALVDLRTGDVLSTASAINPQHPWGADVLSRIAAVRRDGLDVLRRPLVEQAEALAEEAVQRAGAEVRAVSQLVAVGNTAMRGFFLGQDVTPLGAAPYEGVPPEPVQTVASTLGLRTLDAAAVYVPPCASVFVGADAIAGLVAARFASGGTPRLFVDLGTNAEIVLWTGSRLLATSAAAGPALEGAGLSSGMRAVPGAVEDVRYEDGALRLDTIGSLPPVGLCGSGALSLTAALLEAGAVAPDGRLADSPPPPARIVDRDDQRVLVLEDDGPVTFTQKDVRAIQLAKGAVQAAIGVLLAEAGLEASAVKEVLVAGGFGRRLEGRVLARLGVIPTAWADRVRVVGNAALDGARAVLVSSAARAEAERLASVIEPIDLAAHSGFRDAFVGALGFPEP
ncbi:MAG: ASKHA domain-containing protein [Anaerosomatales bacterium]|nr:ASKHA domain-containing protein [Anaerosomatales bacterium]